MAASPGPLVPAWVAMPLGAVALTVIALNMHARARSEMPASRRRIRNTNDWVMLLATPVTACAFGVATPAEPRLFLLSWLAVVGLLAIVLVLAGLDIANTGRISVGTRRGLHRELHDLDRAVRAGSADARAKPHKDGHA